jgi:hypothetical protein
LNLDDLIQYETEGSALDFKRMEYKKDAHVDLLKDVLAMANAHVEGPRRIVTGVHTPPGGPKNFLGIDAAQMRDSASYEQLVGENIGPLIDLKYFPHVFDGKTFGILEISDCGDRPYQMKKDYASLKRGEMWIRKGTLQMLLGRDDLKQIEDLRRANSGFSGKVTVAFRHVGTWPSPESEMHVQPRRFELPSDRVEREIRSVIAAKQTARTEPTWIPRIRTPFSFIPYEERTLEELHEALAAAPKLYEDDDLYTLSDRCAEIVNFRIVNEGDEYLEDARFALLIATAEGVTVADRHYEKPIYDWQGQRVNRFSPIGGYPTIKHGNNMVLVTNEVGNLRHKMATPAFSEGFRMCFREASAGTTLDLKWTIHGRNLRVPLSGSLKIVVSEKLREWPDPK